MRTDRRYTLTHKQWEELNKPADIDPKKLPPVLHVTFENDHPFKETEPCEDSDKVRQFIMDAASEALDELTEEEQRERYEEDMDRIEEESFRQDEERRADEEEWTFDDKEFQEEFEQSLWERRKRQGHPITGGTHHCRYVPPVEPEQPALTLEAIRAVVREEVGQVMDEFLCQYHVETKMDHEHNKYKLQTEKQLEERNAYDRIDRFESLITRLERVGK